jgi:hypothetical protein
MVHPKYYFLMTQGLMLVIESSATEIALAMGGAGKIIVGTSPVRRAYETAEGLLSSNALSQMVSQEKPTTVGILGEAGYYSLDRFGGNIVVFIKLSELAESIPRAPEAEGPRGLVLVTHDTILRDIVRNFGSRQTVNTDYAGVNRFQL